MMQSKIIPNYKQLVSSNLVSTNSGSSTKTNLKFWQIALLIGVPSATAVLAFLYYRYSQKNQKPQPESKSDSNLKKEVKNTETPAVPKSTLEQAIDKKNQGNSFFQKGKFKEAADLYSEAIDLCPLSDKDELPKFYQNRAAAHENLKMYENVVEDCTAALKIDPNYEKPLMRRAKAYENLGKLQESFEDLTSLCILQKFSPTSMAQADKLVKKIGEQMAAKAFAERNGLPISQHFVNNFYIGLYNDVIFNNKKFYELTQENESSVMSKAIEQFNQGDYVQCLEFCTQEIDENKEYALEARNLRGSLYMLKCQYKEARKDFDEILSDSKSSNRLKSNSYIKLTALNLQNNQEAEAFENYDRAIELDPDNEDIYCNRAQVFAMKGRFEDCFKDFDKCISINSDHKIAKLQKAFFEFRQFYAQLTMYMQATQSTNLLLESKELKQETEKLEKLLLEFSDVPEAYNLYAQILSEQENYEKAENYYKIALEKDSKNAALLVQRALNIMTWKNDFEEPIKMLNEAIEIDKTCEFAFETLATIEIQRGNLPRAVELFEKAIQLTRSEDSMTNLCCMLVGAKTQHKVLSSLSSSQHGIDLLSMSRNSF